MIYQKIMDDNWNAHALGTRIRSLRGAISQTAFAELLGISQEDVSRFEAGIRTPSVPLLLKLSAMHRVSLDWLLKGKNDSGEALAGEPAGLPPQEEILLDRFRQLTRKDRTLLLTLADRLRP
ncbi:MAG: helix-turn-helix domain-containing protein [Leptospirales bacterium]